MVEAHRYLAYAVVAGCLLAGVVGLVAYRRGGQVSGATIHLLALPQTLLVAQAALGLLLLSGDYRAADELHYVYGAVALGVVLSPGSTRRPTLADGCSGSQSRRSSPRRSVFVAP